MKLARTKRVTSSDRFKVEKKVKAHNKKARKIARDNPGMKKGHKDPGIPNSWPFKEEAIRAVLKRKELEADERKEANRVDRERRQMLKSGMTLEQIAAQAEHRQAEFQNTQNLNAAAAAASSDYKDEDRHVFWKELNKVVDMSDVIIQVLDARDPESCRSKELEDKVILAGKRLVLLINKIDLIPKEALQAWTTRLSRSHPVKAFKAARNVQHKATHAHVAPEDAPEGLLQSSATVVGAEELIELLKNYSRQGDKKASLTVGIVGYPNVGKSSVINSLLRKNQSVKVGGEAGVTRELQSVQLDSKVRLVDSPGVVFSQKNDAASVLRNAVKLQNIRDRESIIEDLITKCPIDLLCRHYQIPAFTTAQEFIFQVATKLGKLKRGGVPDVEATAIAILKEWTSGKIKFYTFPAAENDPNASARLIFNSISDEEFNAEQARLAREQLDAANDESVGLHTVAAGLAEAQRRINGEDSDCDM